MSEIISAAVGALVTGVLGIWLLPIWREARRTAPHSTKLPDYCNHQSPNRLVFRFFQWVYWGEVPLIKAPIELLEDRLKRPQTSASGMITKSEGAVYRFEPMPVFQSMLAKLPLIIMASFFLLMIWTFAVIFLTGMMQLGNRWEMFHAGLNLFLLSIAVTFAVLFLLSPFTENALVVLVQDKLIRIRWLTAEPVETLPKWRIAPDLDESFSIRRALGSITLIEVLGNDTWRPACRPKWISFQISRLIEQDKDWKRAFADYRALLRRELGEAASGENVKADGTQVLGS